MSQAQQVAGAVGQAAGKAAKGSGFIGRTFKSAKKGALIAGIAAGVTALGMWALSSRKHRAEASRETLENAAAVAPVDNNIPPVMMAPQEQTIAGVPIVEGEHVARVRAGRGLAPAAVNPAMTAVPEESVQNLGPAATR